MDGPWYLVPRQNKLLFSFSESKRVTAQLKDFPVTMHAGSDLNVAVI